jgi:X-Pro dipeptidyl-peptidase
MPHAFSSLCRYRLPLATGFAAAAAVIAPHTAHAQGAGKTVPVFENGQAQIVEGFRDPTAWIKQELWVETEFDSDGDGKKDRMHVDVTRPKQTDSEGLKVAVVYASSPYFAGTSNNRANLWNVNQEVNTTPPPRQSQPEIPFRDPRPVISQSEINFWVPRGFAVVHSEAPGTGLSQGCPTVGGAPEELAPKAVIDWLNGRAKGYTSRTGTEEIKATWSTGKVGMTGTSYEGTLPLAAAVTGVKGLEAIIPIAPNTSYYHYYRSNGLVRHPGGWLGEDIDYLYDFIHSGDTATRAYCNRTIRDGLFAQNRHRENGDYNQFWADRDLLTKVKNVKAATLLAHGLNDWNVVPEHSIRIYEALRKQGTPAQLYLHQGGHGGQPTVDMRLRWFTHYLYGVDNGVERDPKLAVVREQPRPRQAGDPPVQSVGRGSAPAAPVTYADYPNPGAQNVIMHLGAGGNSIGALTINAAPKSAPEKLIDDVSKTAGDFAMAATSNNRLLYATPELKEDLHLSGTATIKIRLASSKPAANLSVLLVQLPFDNTRIGEPGGMLGIITRGWADPQNYKSLTKGGNYDSMSAGEPLKPGQFYTLTFDLQPDDQIIPAGKRLALMIMSSDKDFTVWPQAGTELTVDLGETQITLPVVGGSSALARAVR